MSFLNRQLTVAGCFGVVVCLFGVFWALLTPEMLYTRAKFLGAPASHFWGQVGGWLLGLCPFLGVIAGWGVLRGRRGWKWQVAAVAVGAIVCYGAASLGFWLVRPA